MLATGLALIVLTGCSTSPEAVDPDRSAGSDPTSPTGPATAEAVQAVRATLGAIDPCALLAPPGADVATVLYAEGPHTCEGELDGARVRVEVGVPFDDADRAAAEPRTITGLTAYADPDLCRLVFGVGSSHGVAVEMDASDRCGVLPRAGEVVAAALTTDVDDRLRAPGPDAHSACGLLAEAVDDPGALTDAAGDSSQGLDYCELATDPPLARTALRLSYTELDFDKLAASLGGERITLSGQPAVLVRGEDACYLHTYLWSTDAEGRGRVHTDAVLTAKTCAAAQSAAKPVVAAAERAPDDAGSVDELLNRAQ